MLCGSLILLRLIRFYDDDDDGEDNDVDKNKTMKSNISNSLGAVHSLIFSFIKFINFRFNAVVGAYGRN